ncbi:MAG: polymerase [Frankiales bacterium]|nr:polymerase [Frankiales bacterium]
MSSGSRLKSRPLSALLAAAVVGTGAVALAAPAAAATGGVLVYGLTESDQIVQFRAGTPGTLIFNSPVVGIAANEELVGIDVRPATGALYGVVDGPVSDRVITINPTTGAITSTVQLATALTGKTFGVDFNPMADRLRIVGDDDSSYNVTVDGANGGAVLVQGAINPADAQVRGVAYLNNVAGAASTQLLDLDTTGADRLAQQNVATGALTYRGLTGTDVSESATSTASVGFDIEAVTGTAYALLEGATGREALYTVDLTTGAARLVGAFDDSAVIEDIAVASPRFSVADASANEGSSASVVVTRSGDTADTATVQLALTTGGAAGSAAPSDFTSATPTVTFAAGATTAAATIALTADTEVEPSETFTVTISTPAGPGGNAAVADATGIVTILDGPGTAPGCSVAASVVLQSATIIATGSAGVSVKATPGKVVDLFAYTRPSIAYRLVRSGTTGADGTLAFAALKPPANTRLYAQERGCAIGQSVVLNVRTAISLFAKRNATRDYTFSGDSLPARPGGLIVSLYRVNPNGSQVLTSQVRASATTGDWVINRRFTGSGRFGFVVRTGQDLQNAPGASNVRPTLIY